MTDQTRLELLLQLTAFPDVLMRTANLIGYDSPEHIRETLLAEGLTEYQAWLTYKAAEMLAKDLPR